MKSLSVFLIIISITTSCVPMIKKDYHMAFDELKKTSSSMELGYDTYVLNKGRYSIYFFQDIDDGLKLYIYSLDEFGKYLNLSGQNIGEVEYDAHNRSINDFPCGIFEQQPFLGDRNFLGHREAIKFTWHLWRPHCGFDKVKNERLSVKLIARDKEGKIIGSDEIFFFIKFRGFKVYIDSI